MFCVRIRIATCLRKIEKLFLLCCLTRRYNHPGLSRTNFHGPKGVTANEVRLYVQSRGLQNGLELSASERVISLAFGWMITTRSPQNV